MKSNLVVGECHGAGYLTHFYCLVGEADIYSGRVFTCRSSDLGSIPGWDR